MITGLTAALLALSCGSDGIRTQPTTINLHTTGDTIPLLNGLVILAVPAGAVARDTTVTATVVSNPLASPLLVGPTAVDIQPTGLTFAHPILVTVKYAGITLPAGVLGRELRVYTDSGGMWRIIPGGRADTSNQTVSASISHFSIYGLMGLPVDSIIIAPPNPSISTTGTVQLSATALDSTGTPLPNRKPSWSSGAPTVASVDTTGLVTGHAVGSAVIKAKVEGDSAVDTVTVTTSTSSATPWMDFNFDSYTTTAAYRAATANFAGGPGTTNPGEFDANLSQQFIDTALGTRPAALDSITQAVRYDYPSGGDLSDYVIARSIPFPTSVGDFWAEIWLKYSPNFSLTNQQNVVSNSATSPTVVYAPGSNVSSGYTKTISGNTGSVPSINGNWIVTHIDADHFSIPVNVTTAGTGGTVGPTATAFKGIFGHFDRDGYGRFSLYLGYGGSQPPVEYRVEASNGLNGGDVGDGGVGTDFGDASQSFNGTWVMYRLHWTVGTIGGDNTVHKVRVYDSAGNLIASHDVTHSLIGASVVYSGAYPDLPLPKFRGLTLFANIDPGTPNSSMSIWIARIRLWNSDPGWGF